MFGGWHTFGFGSEAIEWEENKKNWQKLTFSPHWPVDHCHSKCLNPSKSSDLVTLGPWDVHWHKKSCFQRFGWVFKATRGVKTELVPKKSYFCWNHKVKSAISSTAIKHPKAPKFLNILAIFQNNLVKRMGKALVPAVPRLFSHLGHPSAGSHPLGALLPSAPAGQCFVC